MNGQKYAVAEYENQQNHLKELKTNISQILAPTGCGREAAAPPLVQTLAWCT